MTTTSVGFSFLRLAKQVFLNVAIALILFFLPIEMLFRLSSWNLFMPALDMVTEVAMMILMLALVSASLAVLVAGVGSTLVILPFRRKIGRIEEMICSMVAIGSLAIIIFVLLYLLESWVQRVTGFSHKVVTANLAFPVLALVIAISMAWAWKYGFLAAGNVVQSRLAKGNRGGLVLIASAGLVIGVKGITFHDYREIKANPIPTPRVGMPNVILLSIDALTAEDMSLYGYDLPTTPKLEAFARESYVFDNFFASSNWTLPTTASFISGLYPATSGVYPHNSYFLEDDRKKNLGQALKDNGYQTAAIVVNFVGHPLAHRITDSFSAVTEPPISYIPISRFKLKDYQTTRWAAEMVMFSKAFQLLTFFRTPTGASNEENYPLPAKPVFDRTMPFLASPKQPNFVWTHIYPPHSPYLPATPFKHKFGNSKGVATLEGNVPGGDYSPKRQVEVDQIRLRYDELILDADSQLGVFLDKLKAIGRFDDSIIIITADHGESFTKNFLGHGGRNLHQPLIHIPLIVRLPGQTKGKRIPFYAGQVDLLPTVMDLLALPIPEWAEGESLKAAMLEGKPTSKPKFSMSLDHDSRFSPPSKGTVAVMRDGWKLVRYLATGKEELYHVASDPRENTDLGSRDPGQAKKMRDLIYARFNLAK